MVLRKLLLHRIQARGSAHDYDWDSPWSLSVSAGDISKIIFVSGGFLGTGCCFRASGFATLPIRLIPPAIVHLSIDYIGVTLVSLPRYHRGYLQRLFCECPVQVEVRKHSPFMH